MLNDAWLKIVGTLTPDDMMLLKDRGCASEAYNLLEAIERLALAWQGTDLGPINKRDWADIQLRLKELREALS